MPLILSFLLAAQITPMQPMPKGTGLPLADVDTAAVMAPVDRLFAGLAARDAAAISAQLRTDGGATIAIEKADGSHVVRHLSWAEFTAGIKPGPEKYEERLTDPAIEVDYFRHGPTLPFVWLCTPRRLFKSRHGSLR